MTVKYHCMIHMPSLFIAKFRNKSVFVYLLRSVCIYEIHQSKKFKSLIPEREVEQTVHLACFDDSFLS